MFVASIRDALSDKGVLNDSVVLRNCFAVFTMTFFRCCRIVIELVSNYIYMCLELGSAILCVHVSIANSMLCQPRVYVTDPACTSSWLIGGRYLPRPCVHSTKLKNLYYIEKGENGKLT